MSNKQLKGQITNTMMQTEIRKMCIAPLNHSRQRDLYNSHGILYLRTGYDLKFIA